MKVKSLIIVVTCILSISCSEKRNKDFAKSEFVFIKPGTYKIGSPLGEKGRWPKGEEDIRAVKTSGFYISRTEITEQEYYSVVDSSKCESASGNLPVVNVSWLEALQYCNLRSRQEGLQEVYDIPAKDNIELKDINIIQGANGYRLPNIDEWEIACRAGSRTPYYTGKSISSKQANYNSSGRMAVASFPPNKFGMYDMCGNVCEWCYKNEYFAMYKGGSWNSSDIQYLRSGSVGFTDANTKNNYTGFRIAVNDMPNIKK